MAGNEFRHGYYFLLVGKMTYTTHPTVVTGQTWAASDQNTYVKDNLDELFPYTAALQIAYSTSTATLAAATSTAALLVVRSNSANTAIEFGAVPTIYKRQGSTSTTDWYTNTSTSNTNHTPATPIIQVGCSYSTSTAASVTFPTAYSGKPIVFAVNLPITSVSSTGFICASTSAPVFVSWMAIGDL